MNVLKNSCSHATRLFSSLSWAMIHCQDDPGQDSLPTYYHLECNSSIDSKFLVCWLGRNGMDWFLKGQVCFTGTTAHRWRKPERDCGV